jgi:polysaccharide export outer membrane protein
MRRAIAFFAVLSLVSAQAAVAQSADDANTSNASSPVPAVPPAPLAPHSGKDVIGSDDAVTIVALQSEELNKTWHVSGTGDLDLPLVGKMHVAGLTADQFQDQLINALKQYIINPQVTAYISEFRSQPVTVTGAVHRPGTFQTEGPKTLWTILTMAGGLEKDPGATVTITRQIRNGMIPLTGAKLSADGQYSTIDLQMKDVQDTTSPQSNLLIQPNDTVSVSTDARLVFIIGEVIKPGAVELVSHDSISMMQVLAAANGLSKLAAPGHSEIMRKNSQGLYEKVASIDLKKLVNGKIEDRMLTAGDIVVVPSSALKVYSQIASMSAITSGFFLLTRY